MQGTVELLTQVPTVVALADGESDATQQAAVGTEGATKVLTKTGDWVATGSSASKAGRLTLPRFAAALA
ncbi:hypothetical protein SSPIM334S_01752 [Streptomyces spiroverticillatus]